jgi:hypothetical protein
VVVVVVVDVDVVEVLDVELVDDVEVDEVEVEVVVDVLLSFQMTTRLLMKFPLEREKK